MTLSLSIALVGLLTTAIVAMREHARVVASRRTLLDCCASLLSETRVIYGSDGFPTLEGRHRGHYVRAELLPDTMTIRRLPQLWLKLTRLEARPNLAEFSVLVRPSGMEFYSLTDAHSIALEPPAGIASEIIARGNRRVSQRAVDNHAPVLRRIFSDARMKEIAVTAKGLRLIWQAAEGARGDHLIFRQCRFESASVEPATFATLLSALDSLSLSLEIEDKAQAA
jgi:hypothetical protein